MRLRVVAASALAVLTLGGLAACGHDKPGPAPTTVTPTRPPTTPVPTHTTLPPTPTSTGCGLFNPNCSTTPPPPTATADSGSTVGGG